MVAEGLGAERLVFVDEMGANTSLAPLYAWSRKGQRACFEVPRNWGSNVTLLASITAGGMGPCLAVEGSTTREVFEVYVEKVPPPKLRAGRVVVMDNLSAHKGSRVRQLIEERGCKLMYLPPYSPDYNPIEQAFSKVKGLLWMAEVRTREALVEAMGAALSKVTHRIRVPSETGSKDRAPWISIVGRRVNDARRRGRSRSVNSMVISTGRPSSSRTPWTGPKRKIRSLSPSQHVFTWKAQETSPELMWVPGTGSQATQASM
jgi:transposase